MFDYKPFAAATAPPSSTPLGDLAASFAFTCRPPELAGGEEVLRYRGWEIRLQHAQGLRGWIWAIRGPAGQADRGAMCHRNTSLAIAQEEIDRQIDSDADG